MEASPGRKRQVPARYLEEVYPQAARSRPKKRSGRGKDCGRGTLPEVDLKESSSAPTDKAKKSKRARRRPRDPLDPLGYALRLSDYHNYGSCGVPEEADSVDVVNEKVAQLAKMVLEAPHCVVHTGAGISTSAGIPDFRGVNGVWTRHQKGDPLPASVRAFATAVVKLCNGEGVKSRRRRCFLARLEPRCRAMNHTFAFLHAALH